MNDIKSVVSVIKILERTIGILENCNDTGGITGSTRKRVIEMLNKATLEIYFLDDSSDNKISKTDITSPKEQALEIPETAEMPEIPEVIEEADEILFTEDIVPEESVVPEESAPEVLPGEELIEIISSEETLTEEKFVEEEGDDEDIIENISGEDEENTVSEDAIFNRQDNLSDKPLFEWEIDTEPVQKTQEENINLLKLQLEEERKRLEQELQNWQNERRKRDEEILAAKKLLESLQQQTALNQAKQQTVNQQFQPVVQQPQPVVRQSQPVVQQPQPVVQQPQPVIQQPQQSQPVVRQPQPVIRQSPPVVQSPQQSQPLVQQPQQPAQSEPLIKREPVKKEETQETISDRFIGTKKVLHENFETDNNMVNQISTPVANLPRAIGINDKFRFIKELFGGDSDLYNETIKYLDTVGSLVSAIAYIESNFSWDKNSDSVKQLISLIRRRYM
jgi:hypothetical protein